MRLPQARGEVSAEVFGRMDSRRPSRPRPRITDRAGADPELVVCDDDLQIALWALYELHYRGFDDVPDDAEWDPGLLATRRQLESVFEPALRRLTAGGIAAASAAADTVLDRLTEVIENVGGPSLSGYAQRHATVEQYRELLVHRSIYHLKESDPHAWVIPRLDGPAKVALAELQYDEFGGGRADRLHSMLFARALEGAELDAGYGAYIDSVPGYTLAVNNAMSLFGLHRRLRGAAMGHLAAFEATSSMPCRRYSGGAVRLGLGPEVAAYFDEHIEADAVHEHLAQTDICGVLVAAEPELLDDVLLGAATCVQLDRIVAEQMIANWNAGASALRVERVRAA